MDSSSFQWTDMIYLITQLSIVTNVLIVAFKALKLFYFQLSILSNIPSLFVIGDLRKCILIRDGAK